MTQLQPGLVGELEETVTPESTAARWHSGLVSAYATPAMIALMETAAFLATQELLDKTKTTVGTGVDVRHLAATPVGMRIRARAELLMVEGNRLQFKVEAWDETDKIGEGMHSRAIIEWERFNRRLTDKQVEMERRASAQDE